MRAEPHDDRVEPRHAGRGAHRAGGRLARAGVPRVGSRPACGLRGRLGAGNSPFLYRTVICTQMSENGYSKALGPSILTSSRFDRTINAQLGRSFRPARNFGSGGPPGGNCGDGNRRRHPPVPLRARGRIWRRHAGIYCYIRTCLQCTPAGLACPCGPQAAAKTRRKACPKGGRKPFPRSQLAAGQTHARTQ